MGQGDFFTANPVPPVKYLSPVDDYPPFDLPPNRRDGSQSNRQFPSSRDPNRRYRRQQYLSTFRKNKSANRICHTSEAAAAPPLCVAISIGQEFGSQNRRSQSHKLASVAGRCTRMPLYRVVGRVCVVSIARSPLLTDILTEEVIRREGSIVLCLRTRNG